MSDADDKVPTAKTMKEKMEILTAERKRLARSKRDDPRNVERAGAFSAKGRRGSTDTHSNKTARPK